MVAKDTGPLDWRIALVDSAGRPTPEFQRRWATQRQNNGLIGGVVLGSGTPTGTPSDGDEYVNISTTPFTVFIGSGGSWHKAGAVIFTDLTDVPHTYTGKGLALVRVKSTTDGVEFATQSSMLDTLGTVAPGNLLQRGATTWGLVTLGALLDGISSTRGSVLFRGATAWSALAPGTSGFVLQTGGTGADPSWVAQSGGGGGGTRPSVVKLSNGARAGDTGGSLAVTLTFSSATTSGNLLIIVFSGFSGSTVTVPAGFFTLGVQINGNQAARFYAKVSAGETSLAASISADHGQFLAYELSGAKFGIMGPFNQFTSGATTWSAGAMPPIGSALGFCTFEYDVASAGVGLTVPSTATVDYAPNTSTLGNHQGLMARLPNDYAGVVSGTCGSAAPAIFATLYVGG